MKRLLVLCSLLVAGHALAEGTAKDPKAAAQALWDKVGESFDKNDAKAFGALWVEDGTLINPGGVTGKGREAVEKVMEGDLGTILKGGKHKFTVESVRAVSPTALWVEGSHVATGVKAPDGSDTLHVHLITLVVKKGNQWLIAEARPYMFMHPPPAPAAHASAAPAMAPKK